MVKIPSIDPTLFTEAEISTNLSTQIIIKAQGFDGEYYTVGAVKRFHVDQSRNFERIKREDGTYELVPGSTEIVIKLERIVFDGLTMTEVFGRGFRAINAQSQPFNIQVETIESLPLDRHRQGVIATYHNCWFSKVSTPIKAEDYLVLEEATVLCERISTQRL